MFTADIGTIHVMGDARQVVNYLDLMDDVEAWRMVASTKSIMDVYGLY